MQKNMTKSEQLVGELIGKLPNQRTQEILALRFGLKDGRKKTLEAIGQKYGVTRERIRQVENAALTELKKPAFVSVLKPVLRLVDDFLNKEGKIAREERLLTALTKKPDRLHPAWGAVTFALTLGAPYQRFVESDKFYPVWSNSKTALHKVDILMAVLTKRLEEKRQPVSFNDLANLTKEEGMSASKRALRSYLDATKQINQNSFGYFGLTRWPEINPRGARDKAYLIFKEEGRPLHFAQVAELINQAGLGNRLARPQTVHNELIKDPRFVLVGRGTYALQEWGYRTGTVRDIIVETLRKEGALSQDELVKKVAQKRLVKRNTILINLQDPRLFIKDKQGVYSLNPAK